MADTGARPEISELIYKHHAEVYRYAYRLTGSAADAEDLSQQTFLIAHQKLGQLRSPEKAQGWLYTVLRRCFLKSVRRKQPTDAGSLELNLDYLPGPNDEIDIDRDALQAALDELSDDFRLVVTMYFFEYYSYQEIAEALDLPIGTVMSRLSRAKGHLRKRLAPGEVQPTGKQANTDRARPNNDG